jgi:hypothetical protein
LAGLPADFPALPPGVPDPRYGSYVINFHVPLVRGSHHIETQGLTVPPRSSCQRFVKDPPYSYAAGGGTVMKALNSDKTDHLVGSDTKIARGSTVTTTWDIKLD